MDFRKLDALIAWKVTDIINQHDFDTLPEHKDDGVWRHIPPYSTNSEMAGYVAAKGLVVLTPLEKDSEPFGICIRALKGKGIDVSEWESC